VKFREAKKALEEMGWELNRVKGSHYHYQKGTEEFICPCHTGDLSRFIKIKIEKMMAEHRKMIKTPLYKLQQFKFLVNFNGYEKSE
jgi:predicted RNA binding protein YcfA (HicA-like mRNA interferase family)